MGLIKAAINSTRSVFGDQWKEYFYCDSMDADTLVKVGINRSGKGKGASNIISNGSVIAVNEGQCMMIVDQGAVVEFSAEPGEFIYDSSSEPTFFTGDFMDNLKEVASNIWGRIGFGGTPGKDQRVYFFNTKEIIGNKYGTPSPIPFRVVDTKIDLDIDISIRCFGEYSYKIENPLLFYKNVCGNIDYEFRRSEIDTQLKSELMTALQPAFGKISAMGIRYSMLMNHTMEIADALNDVLSAKWYNTRGISVFSFGVNSVKASEEDEAMLKELQRTAVFRNANMAAAHLVDAQANAMETAAGNAGGAFVGFAGMNMASQSGGMNAQNLFAMGQQQQMQQQALQQQKIQNQVVSSQPGQDINSWSCSCGTANTGNFCINCGTPKPAPADSWTCSCGTVNTGKFCAECGSQKPIKKIIKCDKCGWTPTDMNSIPKFCPECGDRIDENDY